MLVRGDRSLRRRAVAGATEFLTCQTQADACTVYDSSGNVLYALSSADGLLSPEGISVGSVTGTWAIANSNGGNILLYSLTQSGPVQIGTIDDAGEMPMDVKISEIGTKKGLQSQSFLISNYYDASRESGYAIYIDPSGNQTILDPPEGYRGLGGGVAFDAKNKDCFWSMTIFPQQYDAESFLIRYKGCRNPGKAYEQGGDASGVVIDKKGNLYGTFLEDGLLYKCAKLGRGECSNFTYSGLDPYFMALSADDSTLFAPDMAGTVVGCSTSTLKCETEFSVSGYTPAGIAVLPAAPP